MYRLPLRNRGGSDRLGIPRPATRRPDMYGNGRSPKRPMTTRTVSSLPARTPGTALPIPKNFESMLHRPSDPIPGIVDCPASINAGSHTYELRAAVVAVNRWMRKGRLLAPRPRTDSRPSGSAVERRWLTFEERQTIPPVADSDRRSMAHPLGRVAPLRNSTKPEGSRSRRPASSSGRPSAFTKIRVS